MLRMAHPATGSDFSQKILEHLEITVEVRGLDKLDTRQKYVFASNHPLGGLDGIALVGVLGKKFGDDNVRVMVNDLLMNVKPLADVFLPITKFGKKGVRESTRLFNEAIESGKEIVMFPAGLVSRKHEGGEIRDLEWKKTFVTKAIESGRKIVPIRFEGLNSMRFYNVARWRKRLKIKVNVEQALLPSELCKAKGKRFTISFLDPVDPMLLAEQGLKPREIAERVYNMVYDKESFGNC